MLNQKIKDLAMVKIKFQFQKKKFTETEGKGSVDAARDVGTRGEKNN